MRIIQQLLCKITTVKIDCLSWEALVLKQREVRINRILTLQNVSFFFFTGILQQQFVPVMCQIFGIKPVLVNILHQCKPRSRSIEGKVLIDTHFHQIPVYAV